MQLVVKMFGNLQIQSGEKELSLPTQRSRALLAYVVLNADQRQSRAQLATLLWPESITAHANLRGELPRLRKALEGSAAPLPIFAIDRSHVTFDSHHVTVDVLHFRKLLAQWTAHRHEGGNLCTICCHHLQEAVALYGGDLLEDLFVNDSPSFEEWLLLQREQLQRQAVEAMEALLDHFEISGAYEKVVHYAHQQLALVPWRERTHRRLMQALVRLGNRGDALTQFQQCRRLLHQELAVEPEAQTVDLARAIQTGELLAIPDPQELVVGHRHQAIAQSPSSSSAGALKRQLGVTDVSAIAQQSVPPKSSFAVGAIPEPNPLYGRQPLLEHLTRSVLQKGNRVVGLIGMGGVGKTSLAATFVHRHLPEQTPKGFEKVLWRSLRHAPPFEALLTTWLHQLGEVYMGELPADLDAQVMLLIQALRRQRVLLVLDDCEAILTPGDFAGRFAPAQVAYEHLLLQLGEVEHQSCLLLLSREAPLSLCRLMRTAYPIDYIQVNGLSIPSGQSMLQARLGAETKLHQRTVVERYSGNPMALALVADAIEAQFGGDLDSFLQEETPIFDDIHAILDEQFERLSMGEKMLIEQMAMLQQPASYHTVTNLLAGRLTATQILSAGRSLERRSLLESQKQLKSILVVVPKLVQAYVTEKINLSQSHFKDR